MARGGKRQGSGRPKGAQTLEKEALRELVRARVAEKLLPLTDAQISNAMGISFLVVREKASGKFLRVGKGRAEKLDPETEIVEIWEKDPSIQAYTDLVNRAIDKPKEQEQEIKLSGEVNIVSILRQRHSKQIAEKANEKMISVQAGGNA